MTEKKRGPGSKAALSSSPSKLEGSGGTSNSDEHKLPAQDPKRSSTAASSTAKTKRKTKTKTKTKKKTSQSVTPVAEDPTAATGTGIDSFQPLKDLSYVWTSGDFRAKPRSKPPYNGVCVTATPKYDSKGKIASLELEVEDFTLKAEGVSVKKKFEPVEVGHEWQLPGGVKKDFTATGTAELEPSPVAPDQLVLMVKDGSYGQADDRKFVIGGLLEIPVSVKVPKPLNPGQPSSGNPSTATPIHPSPLLPTPEAPAEQGAMPTAGKLHAVHDVHGGFHIRGTMPVTVADRNMSLSLDVALQPAGSLDDGGADDKEADENPARKSPGSRKP